MKMPGMRMSGGIAAQGLDNNVGYAGGIRLSVKQTAQSAPPPTPPASTVADDNE
jgi:hypothetical protein